MFITILHAVLLLYPFATTVVIVAPIITNVVLRKYWKRCTYSNYPLLPPTLEGTCGVILISGFIFAFLYTATENKINVVSNWIPIQAYSDLNNEIIISYKSPISTITIQNNTLNVIPNVIKSIPYPTVITISKLLSLDNASCIELNSK